MTSKFPLLVLFALMCAACAPLAFIYGDINEYRSLTGATPKKMRAALDACEHLGQECLVEHLGRPTGEGWLDDDVYWMQWRGGANVQEMNWATNEWVKVWRNCTLVVNVVNTEITAWSMEGACTQ